MRIYVITSGIYDDLEILGATTNKYKAQQYKKALEETEDDVFIREFDDLVDMFGMQRFKWLVEDDLTEEAVETRMVDSCDVDRYQLNKPEMSSDYVGFYIHVMVEAETRSDAERFGMKLIEECLKDECNETMKSKNDRG